MENIRVLSGKEAQDYMDRYLSQIFEDYAGEVETAVEESVKETTNEAAKLLRRTPPTPKKTGDYAKGWKASTDKKRTYIGGTVWNPKKPGLAHLLEDGRKAGVTNGYPYPAAPAFPHIQPVADAVGEVAVRKITRKLEGKL